MFMAGWMNVTSLIQTRLSLSINMYYTTIDKFPTPPTFAAFYVVC